MVMEDITRAVNSEPEWPRGGFVPLRVVPSRDRKLNRHIRTLEMMFLRKGDVLHDAGEPADHVVLVRSGHLRLVRPDRAGSWAPTVEVVGPWEIMGEEALVRGVPRRYRAVAGETVALQLLDPGAVLSALGTSRVTRNAFLAASMDDVAFLHHLNSGSGRPPVAGRIASVLLRLVDRLGESVDGVWRIPVRLTHQTLADLAGAHRSTVTTILNEWLYEGWFGADADGFRLENEPALRQLAEFPTPMRPAR
jgi:CRP-like cAMP-binding protein